MSHVENHGATASADITEHKGVRIAVEGCVSIQCPSYFLNKLSLTRSWGKGHGTLHAIYASIEESCRIKGWDGIDLLIIGGDFQVRRAKGNNSHY
jgi:lariat debranching enzyme